MKTYIVQKGDTIYGVSKQFGVSPEEIMKINNLTNNDLMPGQALQIPIVVSTQIYTVKKGDNLYEIAKKYNTTPEELISLNNLQNTLLSIGQTLKVPQTTNQTSDNIYQIYVVKSGDNLYDIAEKYDMTVYELMAINNLQNTLLSIGQELKVKSNIEDSLPENIEECFGTWYKEPMYQTYTVKNGDSLYIIANKYNTTVENLITLNNLKSDALQIGQVLKVKEL